MLWVRIILFPAIDRCYWIKITGRPRKKRLMQEWNFHALTFLGALDPDLHRVFQLW